MHHRIDVTEPLRKLKPFTKQGVIEAEYLHHPARPANTLANMRRKAFGRQARGLRNTHIGGRVAATVQTQGGVGILGHRFHSDTANLIQRGTTNDRAGSAEKGGVPHIVTILHQTVKQGPLVRRFPETSQVAFKRVGREEMVRRLHHRQLFLFQEPPHGHLQEGACRHVVAVEDRHKFAFGVLQRVVDIPGFGMLVGGAGDVMHADVFGELTKLFAPAVIEDPDIELIFRPVDTLRGINGVFHHVEIFVVGGNENIHRRPLGHIFR